MKVLVVGKGGREHALTWKIAQSPKVQRIYAAPGSPGMAQHAECVDIRVDTPISNLEELTAEIGRLRQFVLDQRIDLTVVGPDDVLSAGIVDRFAEKGLKAFGPTAAAARIESDKIFAKDLMLRIGVPTASYRTFSDSAAAAAYVRQRGCPIVIKPRGLTAGKGVVVARTEEEAIQALSSMMEEGAFGAAGEEVVVEDFMEGEEASLFALTDGEKFLTLAPAQDHKAVHEGDKGPNTGGMGAYAPAPLMTPARVREVQERIIRPVLDEMRRLGCPFQGVLYCGLMLTDSGLKVVEFNSRLGDPEAQVVLPLLKNDFVEVIEAVCDGRLDQVRIQNIDAAAVCVVAASEGYPGSYETGREIRGLERLQGREDLLAFHAGTMLEDGRLLTAGGRVMGITAIAADIPAAVRKVYDGIEQISFDNLYMRRDIGHRACPGITSARPPGT